MTPTQINLLRRLGGRDGQFIRSIQGSYRLCRENGTPVPHVRLLPATVRPLIRDGYLTAHSLIRPDAWMRSGKGLEAAK